MEKENFYFMLRTLYENCDGRENKIDGELMKMYIYDFKPFDENFLVLQPSEPIEESRYLQMAPSRKNEELEVETRIYFSNSDDGFKHYRKSFGFSENDFNEIYTIFCNYLDKKVPDLKLWNDVTEEF